MEWKTPWRCVFLNVFEFFSLSDLKPECSDFWLLHGRLPCGWPSLFIYYLLFWPSLPSVSSHSLCIWVRILQPSCTHSRQKERERQRDRERGRSVDGSSLTGRDRWFFNPDCHSSKNLVSRSRSLFKPLTLLPLLLPFSGNWRFVFKYLNYVFWSAAANLLQM